MCFPFAFVSSKGFALTNAGKEPALVKGLAVDADGHIVFLAETYGYSNSKLDFGGGNSLANPPVGLTLFAIDKNYSYLFANGVPVLPDTYPTGVAGLALEPATKNIAFAGWFTKSIDFGAGPVVAAKTMMVGQSTVFTAKYSNLGTLLWGKTFGGDPP
jgi:hypothetical protein